MSSNSITCKTILSKSKIPGMDYVYNPYVGCTHACSYCYAKFMKKYSHHENDEWGTFIDYKNNAIEVLKKEIKKVAPGQKVMLGSVTDIYQPIEKKYELTRKALEVFRDNDVRLFVLTKSDLVLRDIDLLSDFKNIEVGISMSCFNENDTSIIERGAVTPKRRFEAIKKLKEVGIPVYVFMSPIIPYVSKLEAVIKEITPYVDYVMAEVLNLKVTNINEMKNDLLKIFEKEKVDKIFKLCSDEKYLYGAKAEYERLCEKYNIKNNGFFLHNIKK